MFFKAPKIAHNYHLEVDLFKALNFETYFLISFSNALSWNGLILNFFITLEPY